MGPNTLTGRKLLDALRSTLMVELGEPCFRVDEAYRVTPNHLTSLYGALPEPIRAAEDILGGVFIGVEGTTTEGRLGLVRCQLDPDVRDWARGLSSLPLWHALVARYGSLWCAGVKTAFEVAVLLDARGMILLLDLRDDHVDFVGPVTIAYPARSAIESLMAPMRQARLIPCDEGIALASNPDFVPVPFSHDAWGGAWRNPQDGSILMHKRFLRATEFSATVRPERSWEAWCLWRQMTPVQK